MTEPIAESEYQKRMEGVIDLFETAKVIMRQNLRRRNPQADEQEIAARLRDWLQNEIPPDHEVIRSPNSRS